MKRENLLRLVLGLVAVLFCACGDDGGGMTAAPSTGTGDALPPACTPPSAASAVSCTNLCAKLGRCAAGLCALETGDDAFCSAETYEALNQSCLATCDDAALAADAAAAECTLENSCTAILIDKACTPDAELVCGGGDEGSEEGTTEDASSSTSSTSWWNPGTTSFDSSSTGYDWTTSGGTAWSTGASTTGGSTTGS